MADGRLVPSLGTWKGQVTVKGVNHHGTFEVLNSNGAWALLFGKLLLEAFHVVHDYSNDVIRLPKGLQTPQPFPLAPRSGNTRRLYPHMMKRRDLSREEIMEANIRVHQLFQKMKMMN